MKLIRCLVLLLSSALLARADLLPPARDTSSLSGKLTAATGKATTLPVTALRKSYVLFDLTTLPGDVLESDIAQARLRIYFPSVPKAGDLVLRTVTPSTLLWNETATVAAPAVDAEIATIPKVLVVAKQFVEVDVTPTVRAWRAGTLSNFGFAFTATGTTSVTLGAKEGPGSGYPCQLEVQIDRETADGSIGAGQIANGSVTWIKLGVGAAAANLAEGSVALSKLAASSLSINAGVGLTGGGPVALGGTLTLSLGANLKLGGTTTGTFSGDGSGLTNVTLADAAVTNEKLANSKFVLTAGAGLTGGGEVTLGGATTLALAENLTLAGTTSGTFSGSVLLPAGTATVAPLRLQTGIHLTAPVAGAVEFDGATLYLTTDSGNPVRRSIAFTDSPVSNAQLAPGLTLGGLTTGAFSGNLAGNATTATSFTVGLAGDVIGSQGATVVSAIDGLTAANVAAGASLANAATPANTPGALVRRDANGNLSAGIITATFSGNGSGLTNLNGSALAAGSVSNTRLTSSSLTVAPGTGLSGGGPVSLGGTVTLSLGSGLTLSGTTTFAGPALLPAGTSTVAPLRLQTGANLLTPLVGAVEFDGTNLFLTTNGASPTRRALAFTDSALTTAISFTGPLAGEVTGSQAATVVASVGGVTAASIATGVNTANAATPDNTPGTIVRRDASGNFSAGTISAAGFYGSGVGITGFEGHFPWVNVTSSTQQAAANTGYLANSSTQVTITLPVAPAPGDRVRVTGAGVGGWKIAQNAGQSIAFEGPLSGSFVARDSRRGWTQVASSSDGTKLLAAASIGQLYTSADSGVTWTPHQNGRYWKGVASSADGTKLLAAAEQGQLYTSTDSGTTWTARETSRWWGNAVASSADGTKLLAAPFATTGQLYLSSDSGVTWTARATSEQWMSAAASADGSKLIAAAYNERLYTSTNSGVTWTGRETDRQWRGVASSADGTKLVAVADQVLLTSIDSGVSWTQRYPSESWVSVASSADGTKLVAATAAGLLYTSSDSGVTWKSGGVSLAWSDVACSADGEKVVACAYSNQIYTLGSATATGTDGSVSGGRFSAIELQYIGNGQFMPLSSYGTITAY